MSSSSSSHHWCYNSSRALASVRQRIGYKITGVYRKSHCQNTERAIIVTVFHLPAVQFFRECSSDNLDRYGGFLLHSVVPVPLGHVPYQLLHKQKFRMAVVKLGTKMRVRSTETFSETLVEHRAVTV
jgi:hypothetical protein